jgi:hypothetical protein
MPTPSYELTRLDANTFEHLANTLALKVLGAGHTGFGPGPDAGRDGYFEGPAPYPSTNNSWSGIWYIQSKFLRPHLSKDPQKWLLDRISEEISAFTQPNSPRVWPDNWIIVTNIETSGAPQTGSFDKARAAIQKVRPQLAKRFHIWGGRKVLDLLALYPEIGEYYGEFVTPGQVLSQLYAQTLDSRAQVEQVIRYLIVTQFIEQQYTKLEQAGSTTDNRPGIQRLYADVPFVSSFHKVNGMAAAMLAKALAQNHRIGAVNADPQLWSAWQRDPARARIWFVKGGPGQGKSTLTQYISQIQRAALILHPNGPTVTPAQRALAEEVRDVASRTELWPLSPRIPISIDLKEFAFWFGQKPDGVTDRIIGFLTERLTRQIGEEVKVGTLRRAFGSARWLFVFDGLDEVPGDVKDAVANEVRHFVDDMLVGYGADASVICTSRPQGYSGQFGSLNAAVIELVNLSREQALACAKPLLALDRSDSERRSYVETLRAALQSPTVAAIMTTPLQAHIMAVIVRDGGKPPERKWQLFDTFYQVIKKREANRNLPDRALAKLLQEGDKLLKAIHNRLGFELHARAETSQGAVTSLARKELQTIVHEVVSQLQDDNIAETVNTLMRATTDRLVLVSTPESGDSVRFDIRPLQEFFAAEHIYQSGEPDVFVERIRAIAGDSHWREVMHFLLSALVEQNRKSELAISATVLSQIDDAGDNGVRSLNRRLARGGIIAARLLQEGVLEQDKRVREQFRSVILPLLGCADANFYLSDVKSSHSHKWLCDVLITSLREQAEPETIGAAVTLADVLSDADSRSVEVKQFILNMSPSYFRFFYEEVGRSRLARIDVFNGLPDKPRDSAPRWLLELALRPLLNEDWWRLGAEGVQTIINILEAGEGILSEVAANCGVALEVANLVAPMLCSRDHQSRRASFTETHGIMRVEYFAPDKALRWTSWANKVWSALETSKGFLQSAYRLFALLRSPDSRHSDALLASVGGRADGVLCLPPNLRAYIAHDFDTDDEFNVKNLIERKRPGYTRMSMLWQTKMKNPEWKALIRGEPWLILYLLDNRDQAALRAFSDTSLQQALLERLEVKPVLMDFISRWGVLFQLPGDLGKGLRCRALESSARPVSARPFWRGMKSFCLELPKEADWLPHLTGALLVSRADRRSREGGYARLPPRKELSELIAEYVPDPVDLHDIAAKPHFTKRVRSAATLLYYLHPKIIEAGGQLPPKERLIEYYEPSESSWYLPAVALLLSEAVAANQSDALETIGHLIECASTDYPGRYALNDAIKEWRELARAPVQKLSTPQLWI